MLDVEVYRVINCLSVWLKSLRGVSRSNSVERRKGDLGSVSGYLGVKIGGSGIRVFFGFVPVLLTLSVLKTYDPPVILAVGLCRIADFE
jgi:hypothetical protein